MGLGYGLTECTALATVCSGQELIDHPLSCGKPLPTVEFKEITTASGAEKSSIISLPAFKEGLICLIPLEEVYIPF